MFFFFLLLNEIFYPTISQKEKKESNQHFFFKKCILGWYNAMIITIIYFFAHYGIFLSFLYSECSIQWLPLWHTVDSRFVALPRFPTPSISGPPECMLEIYYSLPSNSHPPNSVMPSCNCASRRRILSSIDITQWENSWFN